METLYKVTIEIWFNKDPDEMTYSEMVDTGFIIEHPTHRYEFKVAPSNVQAYFKRYER